MGIKITREPVIPNSGRIRDEVVSLITDVTEHAEQVIENVVETSGTNRTWSSPWPSRGGGGRRAGSGPGRIETGEMFRAVSSNVEETDSKVVGTAGWVNGGPEYLQWQEDGFRHYISGEMIEGMKSLDVAFEDGKEMLLARASHALRAAMK